MSHFNVIEVECPDCHTNQFVRYYDSVNTKLNPELRTDLMEGRLNGFVCKCCKEVYSLGSPLLYHDMTRHFAVQFFPEGLIQEDEFIRDFIEPGDLNMRDETDAPRGVVEAARYLGHPHIVFDLSELKRYVLFSERVRDARTRKERES